MGRDATFRRQQVINCTQFSSKIHPEIMTDQKQSGTKKPLLTHYRQQLMAHVVSSYAGCDLDIRCRSWECPSRSLLASHWSQRCFPGSWLAECSGKHFPSVGVGLALEMFYKANWCSLSCLHQMLGTTQTSFPADILRTSSQLSQSEACVKLCWPIRFGILSMVVEIWDVERFMRTDLWTVSHGGLQFLHSSPSYHWSRSQSGIIWSCLDIL